MKEIVNERVKIFFVFLSDNLCFVKRVSVKRRASYSRESYLICGQCRCECDGACKTKCTNIGIQEEGNPGG